MWIFNFKAILLKIIVICSAQPRIPKWFQIYSCASTTWFQTSQWYSCQSARHRDRGMFLYRTPVLYIDGLVQERRNSIALVTSFLRKPIYTFVIYLGLHVIKGIQDVCQWSVEITGTAQVGRIGDFGTNVPTMHLHPFLIPLIIIQINF